MGFPWVIIAELGVSIGLNELQKWLSNPPADDRPRQMSNIPSTAEGSPIPAVFGKVLVRRPVLVWHGGFKLYSAEALTGSTPVDPATGLPLHHWYGINMLFAVGIPPDEVIPPSVIREVRLTGVYFDGRKLDLNLGHEGYVDVGPLANPLEATGRIQFFAGLPPIAGGAEQLISNYDADINQETHEIAYWMRHPDGAAVDHTLIPGYRKQMLVAFSGRRNYALHEGEIQAGEKLGAFVFGPTTALPDISFELSARNFRYGV